MVIKMANEKDLELKALHQFNGTTKYYEYIGMNVTDGIVYIMNNGYSWLVSDAIFTIYFDIRIKEHLKKDKFLVIKLKVNRENKTAKVTFEDGNNNVLVYHIYDYTDAKVDELVLYYVDGVLMLSNEY
jgi:hypothetical protein